MRRIGFVILILALVFAVGCGGSSSSTPTTPTTPATNTPVAECIQFLDNSFFFGTVRLADVKIGGNPSVNVAPLIVDAGPPSVASSNSPSTNVAFTTVTVCTPGTSTCVTIDHIAVDTGSTGLRIPASLLSTLNLPNVTLSTSTPATGGSTSSSELASSVPIHVMGDASIPTGSSIPTSCSTTTALGGSKITGIEEDSVAALGANGLLGVGNYQYDCDFVGNLNPCTSSSTLPTALYYYTCSSSTCSSPIAVPVAQQVRNPVSLFTDNNGVILELSAVTTGVGGVNVPGSMVFGIGTRANNGLSSSAVVLPLDPTEADPAWMGFTTVFNGVSYPNQTEDNTLLASSGNTIGTVGSFLDSGSNGIFFLDQPTSGIADCSSTEKFFYCPGSPQSFPSVTNKAFNGNVSPAPFSVTSANTLFLTNGGNNTAFSDLAGPNTPQNPGNPNSVTQAADGFFDWGLPFFFGRNVYTAIQGVTPPSTPASGVAVPAGPWWAY